MNWYIKVMKQSFDYKGRARRKEFWMFILFNTIFVLITMSLILFLRYIMNDFDSKDGLVELLRSFIGIYILAILIPSLALTVRRLHDVGKSGWMILVSFIPIIGEIWLLILMFTESNSNTNEYGVNPKEIGI